MVLASLPVISSYPSMMLSLAKRDGEAGERREDEVARLLTGAARRLTHHRCPAGSDPDIRFGSH
jgi:hypothetical protein